MEGLLQIGGLDPRLLHGLCSDPKAIIREGYGGRSGILANRQKFRCSRPALSARGYAMASPYHPFYFAELLLPEELKDFVDHADAEAHLPT